MAWLVTSLHRRVVSSAQLFSTRLSSAQLSSAQLCSAQLLTTYQLLPTYHLSSQPKTRKKKKACEWLARPDERAVGGGMAYLPDLQLYGALGGLESPEQLEKPEHGAP